MTIVAKRADQAQSPVSVEEFDAFLATQGDPRGFELVDGEIVMMADPAEAHEQIAGNIGAPLKPAMDKRNCRTYQGGMRIQRDDDARKRDKPKPDVVVRCREPRSRTYVTDPIVVVEVLSPSTMDTDRGSKLDFYKSLPTMQHIVLAYQDQRRLEHDRRTEAGWDIEVLSRAEDILLLDAVEFEIGLDAVYFGIAP